VVSLETVRWGVAGLVTCCDDGMKSLSLVTCCDDGMKSLSGKNKVLISMLGGIELALSALGDHSSHVGIQRHGLCALCMLAFGSWWWWWGRLRP